MLALLSSVDVAKTPLCGVGQGKPALPSLCGTRFLRAGIPPFF
jgi:hypothetical protein